MKGTSTLLLYFCVRFCDAIANGTYPIEEDGYIILRGYRATTDVKEFEKFVYPNIEHLSGNSGHRALLTLRNRTVDAMNDKILDQFPGDVVDLFSTDELENSGEFAGIATSFLPFKVN
jgi:hypothetical protein